MAAHPPVEICFFCNEKHHGLCDDLKPEKPKPVKKPRAVKKPPAEASPTPPVPVQDTAPVDVDAAHAAEVGRKLIDMSERWSKQAAKRSDLDIALDVLAPILHESELEAYSLRRASRPSPRATEWRQANAR